MITLFVCYFGFLIDPIRFYCNGIFLFGGVVLYLEIGIGDRFWNGLREVFLAFGIYDLADRFI